MDLTSSCDPDVRPASANRAAPAPSANVQAVDVVTGPGKASTGLPSALEPSCVEYHLAEYVRLFQPTGHLERVVVRDLARQTAAMEVWGEGLAALARQRARHLPELVAAEGAGEGDEEEVEDVALAAAISAPDVHLVESYAQRRARAFYRALKTLESLQAERRSREAHGQTPAPESRFRTEAVCEEHLKGRFEEGLNPCPRCGGTRGHYIAGRRCWECAGCGRQAGLRAGTVMADSPLPLVTWFAAIQMLLWRPTMATAELAHQLGITRSATVRGLAAKIRAALAAENASQLLAGFDRVDGCDRTASPESSVPADEKREPNMPPELDMGGPHSSHNFHNGYVVNPRDIPPQPAT